MSLEWNVYRENINGQRIEPFNIFDHSGFLDDCRKIAKACKDTESFDQELRKSLVYFFRWKCEYEIVLSGWPPGGRTKPRKVDIYSQVFLNWPIFVDYVWENRGSL